MANRKALVAGLRIAASAVMLTILLTRLSGEELRLTHLLPHRSAATIAWLTAALLVTFGGIVMSAVRWQRVLWALELPSRVSGLIWHYLAGLFVSNFLPSTIGGDVLRVTRLSSVNGQAPKTFASVVLERLTGWLVLPVLSLAALVINPTLLHLGSATRLAIGISVATLVLLVVVLLAAASPRIGGRLGHHEGWRRFMAAVHLGLERFRRRPAAAFEVLIVGFAYQLTVVAAVFLAARALSIDVGPTAMLAFVPAVAMVQVLPISLGGLGVREGAFVIFLGALGVSAAQAIALGLVVYGLNLVASLLGAPAFAAGTRRATPAQSVGVAA